MPLTNVFRQPTSNPFHSQSRRASKSHDHANVDTENVDSIVSGGVVIASHTNNKKDKKGRGKGKSALYDPSSTLPSPTSPTSADFFSFPSPRFAMPDMISSLDVSRVPSFIRRSGKNENQKEVLADTTPSRTSASCTPIPPSPDISRPSTPLSTSTSAFFTQQHSNSRRFTPSPEPLTPTTAKPTTTPTATAGSITAASVATGRTGTIGSKFGSMFLSKKHRNSYVFDDDYVVLPASAPASLRGKGKGGVEVDQREQTEMPMPMQEPKRKRVSPGSMHIPVGAFLSNAFRSRSTLHLDHLPQQHQQQEHQQPQLKKKRSFLPKLPKLDTRPRTLASSTSLPIGDARARAEGAAAAATAAGMAVGGEKGDVDTKSKSKKYKRLFKAPSIITRNNNNNDRQDEIPISATVSTTTLATDITAPSFLPISPLSSSRTLPIKKSSGILSPFVLPATLRHGPFSKFRNLDSNPNARLPPLPPLPPQSSKSILVKGTDNGYETNHGDNNDPQMIQSSSKELESSIALASTDNDAITVITTTTTAAAATVDVSWNWQQNGHLYHNARWDDDDTSVHTVDSEVIRLSNDTRFPGYPERNAYWQEHCRNREQRHRKHQELQRQQRALGILSRSSSKRFRQKRDRYTVNIAAMQRLANERDRSLDATGSLPADNLGAKARAAPQDEARVAPETEVDSRGVCCDYSNGTNPQRQRQPNSGILFVTSTTTTAEVYPSLVTYDPQSQLRSIQQNQSFSSKNDQRTTSFKTRSSDALNEPNGNTTEADTGDNLNNPNNVDSGSRSNNSSTPSLRIRKEDDHCLSQPGLYASHNHILPLEKLVEMREQEQWRVKQLQHKLRLSLQRTQQQQQRQQQDRPPSRLLRGVSSNSLILPGRPTTPSSSQLLRAMSSSSLIPPNAQANRSTTPSSIQLLRAMSTGNPIPPNALTTPTAATTTPFTPATPTPTSPTTLLKSELPRPLEPALSTNVLHADVDDAADPSVSSSSVDVTTQNLDYRHKYTHRRQGSYSSMNSMTSRTSAVSSRQESSNGHMLLMLHEGCMHYYENGARKTGPEWDYNNLGADSSINGSISDMNDDDSVKDVNQEDDHPYQRPVSPTELRSPHSPHSPRLLLQRPMSTAALTLEPSDSGGRRHSASLRITYLSESPPAEEYLNNYYRRHHHHHSHHHQRHHSASSLGRMRGAKSRASISYSTMPTLATSCSPISSSSSPDPSSPTATLLSAIKLENSSTSSKKV
ncbi:hypothetical protein BGX21_005969 [Mortierella sp. AD011]|nr:hypothetical protein BGX21_005969 [Mortierella sp. AD011]